MKPVFGPEAGLFGTLALLVFAGLAVAVILYVLLDRRRAHHRAMEQLPLDDGTVTREGRRDG